MIYNNLHVHIRKWNITTGIVKIYIYAYQEGTFPGCLFCGLIGYIQQLTAKVHMGVMTTSSEGVPHGREDLTLVWQVRSSSVY